MRKLILILGIVSLITSCSAEWHIRKAISKDPTILQNDTIQIHDTVTWITEHFEVDSIFKLSHDTVVIEKENLIIKHFYNHHTDSVFIHGEVLSDTNTQVI
jgi:hypothetical protein